MGYGIFNGEQNARALTFLEHGLSVNIEYISVSCDILKRKF